MTTIFVSYNENPDGDLAKKIKQFFEDENDKEFDFKVLLAPRSDSKLEESSMKIARLIDSSQFFISLYTNPQNGEDRKQFWLDQEFGYAFCHFKNGFLKIIPVVDKREDFQGLISSKFWDMSIILDRKNPEKTLERIRNVILDHIDFYPIVLRYEHATPDKNNGILNGNSIEGTVIVDNKSPKKLTDAVLDIITPYQIRIRAKESFVAKKIIYPFKLKEGNCKNPIIIDEEENYSIQSTHIPHSHMNKIETMDGVDGKICRSTMNLNDLQMHNSYETNWFFQNCSTHGAPENMTNLKEFHFCVIISLPIYGLKYYQGIYRKDGLKFNLKESKKVKIGII